MTYITIKICLLPYYNMEEANSSKIVFLKKRVLFDSTGYYDGTGIRWEGQMVRQRISDLLPYEYRINNKFLPLTSSDSPVISATLFLQVKDSCFC